MTTQLGTFCDTGVVLGAGAGKPCARHAEKWVLVATVLGSSMAFIDGTAVNVALPALQAEFSASASAMQWVVESYALFLSALIVVGGSLGDKFGRRRMFGAGIVIFAAASAWCGFAPDMGQLIGARAIQGVGGALLIPGSLAILSGAFSPEHRGRAIGTWSAFTAINMALGPVLGGWLVDHVSWRWIFFINLPLAAAVLLVLIARVPESRGENEKARLDWWGAILMTGGLGAVIYGLIELPILGAGHPLIVATLVGGVAALAAFLVIEWRGSEPMVPLGLFRSRSFSGANLLTLLFYAALSGSIFYLPFNLIQVQGYSATEAGAALLPLIAVMFLLSRWSGTLLDRYGGRLPLTVGPLIAAAGFLLFALPGIGGSYWTTFFPAVLVLGVGMAVVAPPLTTVVMNAVDEHNAGVASGINNAVSRVGGLLAVAVMGIIVLLAFNSDLDTQLVPLDVSPEVRTALDAERINLAGAKLPESLTAELRGPLERAIDTSFVSAFRLVMFIAAGLAMASALSAALFIEKRPPAPAA